jgi:hypothetical protein
MSISKSLYAGIGAVALLSFSNTSLAGTSEALAACKSEIASDSRMSQFESVVQSTDEIKRRGRYTNFEIQVRARTGDGSKSSWLANCKARNNGRVEAVELVHISGDAGAQLAQSDN